MSSNLSRPDEIYFVQVEIDEHEADALLSNEADADNFSPESQHAGRALRYVSPYRAAYLKKSNPPCIAL